MDYTQKRAVKKFLKRPRNLLIISLGLVVIIGIVISLYFIFNSISVCQEDSSTSGELRMVHEVAERAACADCQSGGQDRWSVLGSSVQVDCDPG